MDSQYEVQNNTKAFYLDWGLRKRRLLQWVHFADLNFYRLSCIPIK